MLLIIIFHTLSFPMGRILTLVMCKHTTHHMNLHCESKKNKTPNSCPNFTKYWPIFKILSLLDSVGNL